MIRPNSNTIDLSGALFNKKEVPKPIPIHMILYSLYDPNAYQEQKNFVLYMQVGECENIEKTVFKTGNSDEYALEVIPTPLIRYMDAVVLNGPVKKTLNLK
jgi:hypothetical protein